jgi:hypothetical protein
LLFHSTFGTVSQYFFIAVSQYFWCCFTIFVIALSNTVIIGTVSSFIPGSVTVQLYSRPFSSFIPGRVTVQLYSSRFQFYSQPCYCTALFLAMLLFSIIQVLFPTVLPYSFIPGLLFAVHKLFITVPRRLFFAAQQRIAIT